ncbi:hypothetical protein B0H14DRAFT_3595965 [Mycena olivaceomarginata]|nr:hypothetical protein B0H14DRAFT_3595965 [Mycena olivaceomarginata]
MTAKIKTSYGYCVMVPADGLRFLAKEWSRAQVTLRMLHVRNFFGSTKEIQVTLGTLHVASHGGSLGAPKWKDLGKHGCSEFHNRRERFPIRWESTNDTHPSMISTLRRWITRHRMAYPHPQYLVYGLANHREKNLSSHISYQHHVTLPEMHPYRPQMAALYLSSDFAQTRKKALRRQRIEAEKRRRDELRVAYRKLQDALPSSNQRSKMSLVQRATSHISAIEAENEALHNRIAALKQKIRQLSIVAGSASGGRAEGSERRVLLGPKDREYPDNGDGGSAYSHMV